MIYHCDRCGTVLPGGVAACPRCGRRFDQAVPFDTPPQAEASVPEASVDALLRRTAGGSAFGSVSMPGSGQVPAARQRGMPLWARVTAWVAATFLVLALVGWGLDALWMRGQGGEIAFRQHNRAGNAAEERGDFARADDEYGQMIALRPRRVDGYLLRAINEAQEGQPQAAIDDNTQALTLASDPEMRGDLLSNRAESEAKRGRFARAITDFTQANAEYQRERDPRLLPLIPDRRESVYSLRADAYWHRKQYALSIADSKAAIALGHVHPDDYGVQAKAEAALGLDKAAAADFTQALRMDPSYLDGYSGLAALAEKHHDNAQAASVYRRAVQANPGSAQFWGNLGWFQYEAGQDAQAVRSDRRSQSLDGSQTWVRFNLALTYAAVGRSAEARAAYADALAGAAAADRSAALADIRTALAKHPGSGALRQALAQVQGGKIGGPRTVRSVPPLESKRAAPPAPAAARLGPEVTLADGYSLQPPLGYTLTQRREVALNGGSAVYSWSGPRRADGTFPTLEVSVGHDDGSLAAHESEGQAAQDALNGMGGNHTNLRLSPVSSGVFGSVSFHGGDWDGIGVQTGKEYKGSEYWSVTPSHILHLSTHDVFPACRATLPLLQASVRTFRKT